MAKSKPKEPAKAQPAPRAVGRSLDEFRKSYDKSHIVPTRIKAALAGLGGAWMTELEFAKLAGVSVPDLAAYREAYEEHVVVLLGQHKGKRLWAGTKQAAARMREMLR